MALRRSDQGARLKNSHHTTIASVQTTEPSNPIRLPSIPKNSASGATAGTPNLNSGSSTAASTPGHSRRDL